ncbi:hypothetical protein [Streptomyces cyaneofuscatus]|uniref:hypothetical protein n=1 Tax=Streptomyces cyaneofuscatus TaxID=66883 RepID=UPI0033A06D17
MFKFQPFFASDVLTLVLGALFVPGAGCLNNCATGVFTSIGTRGDGARQYRSGSGNIYADEGNHWDVTYYNRGGC